MNRSTRRPLHWDLGQVWHFFSNLFTIRIFFFLPAFASWQTRGSNCLLDWAARGNEVLNAKGTHEMPRQHTFFRVCTPWWPVPWVPILTPWRLQPPPNKKPEKLNFYESFKSMQLEQTNHFSSIFIHEQKLQHINTFVCQHSWHHGRFIPFSVPELLPEKSGDSTCHRMSMSSSIPKRPLTTSLGVVFKTAAVWFPDAKCRSKTP